MTTDPERKAQAAFEGLMRSKESRASSKSFFARVCSYLFGNRFHSETGPFFQGKPVAHMALGELKEKASRILSSLDNEKKALVKECGALGDAFAQRHIEPFLAPLRRLIDEGGSGVSCRITDVEAVTTIQRDLQLRNKIEACVAQQTQQVIAEDIAFLNSFSSEVLDDALVGTQQKRFVLNEIKKKVDPVIEELVFHSSEKSPHGTLLELYRWRSQIDLVRQQLQDRALSLIEESVQLWRRSEDPFYKESLDDQLAYITKIFDLISSGDFEWPKSLFELEEASFFLTRIVENKKQLCFDPRIERLIRQLTGDIDILFEAATKSQYHDILLRVMEHLRSIEDLRAETRPEEEVSIPEVLP